MISPEFRNTEVTNTYDGYKLYITQNHGSFSKRLNFASR